MDANTTLKRCSRPVTEDRRVVGSSFVIWDKNQRSEGGSRLQSGMRSRGLAERKSRTGRSIEATTGESGEHSVRHRPHPRRIFEIVE